MAPRKPSTGDIATEEKLTARDIGCRRTTQGQRVSASYSVPKGISGEGLNRKQFGMFGRSLQFSIEENPQI